MDSSSERIDDCIDLDTLVDDTIAGNTQQEVDKEEEEGQIYKEPLPPVLHSEALQALHLLRRYEEEYKWSESFERDLVARHHNSLEQTTLDVFWKRQNSS